MWPPPPPPGDSARRVSGSGVAKTPAPVSFGWMWSPESYAGSSRLGWAGSRITASKSTMPSNSARPGPRSQVFTAWRVASFSGVHTPGPPLPSYGMSVPAMLVRPRAWTCRLSWRSAAMIASGLSPFIQMSLMPRWVMTVRTPVCGNTSSLSRASAFGPSS